MRRFSVTVALLLAVGGARPALASLVIFQEGRVVKAAGYRVVGDQIEIDLPGGGSFRTDLGRVDRIVDDEVEVPDTVSVSGPGASPAAYDLSYRRDRKPLFATPYDPLIEAEARRANVDAALVSAVIRAESNYQPQSVSRKGARGLMQLMPSTARRLGVTRPFDPVANVRGGARYLRELVERFGGRPELVLAAYNAGESAVDSYRGMPPYRETVEYVKRILSWWAPAAVPAGIRPAEAVRAPPAAPPGR